MSIEDIRYAVENYLEEENCHYYANAENDRLLFTMGFSFPPFHSLSFIIIPRETRLTVICRCPVYAEKDRRRDMALFLTRANYGLSLGNFEMDFEDGEIQYKMSLDLEGEEEDESIAPTHEQLKHAIRVCIAMLIRYGKGILAVNYGNLNSNPAVAYDLCEAAVNNDNDDDDDDDDEDEEEDEDEDDEDEDDSITNISDSLEQLKKILEDLRNNPIDLDGDK